MYNVNLNQCFKVRKIVKTIFGNFCQKRNVSKNIRIKEIGFGLGSDSMEFITTFWISIPIKGLFLDRI